MSTSSDAVLIREDILRLDERGLTILASQDQSAAVLRFPPTSLPGWTVIDLPHTGELFSFSKVHMPSAHFEAGYLVGYVRFTVETGESVLVFGQLRAPDDYEFSIGEAMSVVAGTLWVNAEDQDVVGYIFVPVGHEDVVTEAGS